MFYFHFYLKEVIIVILKYQISKTNILKDLEVMAKKVTGNQSITKILFHSFMGNSPEWFKKLIIVFLIINPVFLLLFGEFFTGWLVLSEFIISLAFALKCHPLLTGGLLALETVFMGMVDTHLIFHEIEKNLEVLLLLMFMVAGIYFMKDFLSWIFIRILFSTRSKILLSMIFSFTCAFLSAWLDALTVTAVMITVAVSLNHIYRTTTFEERQEEHLNSENSLSMEEIKQIDKNDYKNFQGFIRNLLMHGAVGTALGGISTIVGEPQNLIIGNLMNWKFYDFFIKMAHISLPVFIMGLITVIIVEKFKIFDYGYQLPDRVYNFLKKEIDNDKANMTQEKYLKLYLQAICAVWLIIGLAFHLASVGLIGLSVIILLTNLTGKNEESQIGKAFEDAMPFTALIVVFFVIVGMIESTEIFKPIIQLVLSFEGKSQLYSFFVASGILSSISDNVFVGTIYIQEALKAFNNNIISREQLESLAVAINAGTNITSIATPNGQAAFLFLLTSSIASDIKLSYFKMLKMAFPYTILLTLISLVFLAYDWIPH